MDVAIEAGLTVAVPWPESERQARRVRHDPARRRKAPWWARWSAHETFRAAMRQG